MRKTYYICQQGNEISVPDPVMLLKEELLGFILVPMKQVTAFALKLAFDPHDIVTPYANTAGTFNFGTLVTGDIPGDGIAIVAAFPCALELGYAG